jgi:hypothetical protein
MQLRQAGEARSFSDAGEDDDILLFDSGANIASPRRSAPRIFVFCPKDFPA